MASEFLKNSMFGAVAGLLTTMGSFACGLIVARMLGVHASGTVSYSIWLAGTIATISGLGLSSTIARFLPELIARGEGDQAAALTVYLFKILAGAVFAVVLFGVVAAAMVATNPNIRSWLPPAADETPNFWIITAFLFFALAQGGFLIAYLKGMQDFGKLAKITFVSMSAQLAAVYLGSIILGVQGALAGYALGALVPVVLLFNLPRKTTIPSSKLRAQIWSYSWNVWAASIVDAIVWSRAEIFFLQLFWGNESVGLFAIGLTVTNLAIQLPILVTSGVLTHFAERFGRADIQGMQEAYASGTRLLAFLLFPAGLGAAAIMPVLLPVIFGKSFAAAVPSAMILVTVGCFGAVVSVGSNLIYALGRSEFIFRAGLLGALLSLASGLTIIQHFGLLGAALSRGAIQLLMIAIGFYYIAVRLNCPVPAAGLIRLLLSSICCAVTAHVILQFLEGTPGMLVAIPTGAIVYFAAVWSLGALPKQDTARLLNWANDMRGWVGNFRLRSR